MTGEPLYNFEQFFHFAAMLRAAGHEPVNPAELTVRKLLAGWQYDEEKYAEVLIEDLDALRTCDAVLFLEGWRGSKGAMVEHEFAVALDLDRHFVEHGDHETRLGCCGGGAV